MNIQTAWHKLHVLRLRLGLRGCVRAAARHACDTLLDRIGLPVLLNPRRCRAQIRSALRGDFRRVVLWRSSLGFRAVLYQRPQQIARQFARMETLVIYEVSARTDGVRTLRLQEKNLLLVNFGCRPLRRMLMRELDGVSQPKYLQIYSTNHEMGLRELRRFLRRGYRLLYEYVDRLSPEIFGTKTLPKNIRDKFDYAMRHGDVTVAATADRLWRDVLERRGEKRLVLSTNGVDYAFFQAWESYRFEPDFCSVLARGRPIVCYYGAMASWLDYELLREIAACGKYSLVLIGVKYDGSFDAQLHPGEPIDFLGPRDYRVLKYYARAADVLILPFLTNDVTQSASPIKLFEYMALKKPIVSTDLDECRKYPGVLIADSRADFLRLLEKALELRGDESYLAQLDQNARANDWREKAAAILTALDEENPRSP